MTRREIVMAAIGAIAFRVVLPISLVGWLLAKDDFALMKFWMEILL